MIASIDRLFTAPVPPDPLGVLRKERGMSGGNGADLGQVLALLNDVIAMQREFRVELIELQLELKQEIRRLDRRVDDLATQLASLREELASYHATVVGHGMLLSEHDARQLRVEQHPSPTSPIRAIGEG